MKKGEKVGNRYEKEERRRKRRGERGERGGGDVTMDTPWKVAAVSQ